MLRIILCVTGPEAEFEDAEVDAAGVLLLCNSFWSGKAVRVWARQFLKGAVTGAKELLSGVAAGLQSSFLFVFSGGRTAVADDWRLVCEITEVEGMLLIGETAEREVRVSMWEELFVMGNKFVMGTSPVVVAAV